MEDTKHNEAPEEQDIDDPDKTDDEQEEQNDVSLLEENDNQNEDFNEQTEAGIDQEEEDSALLDHDEQQDHANESSLLEENGGALGDAIIDSQNKKLDEERADIIDEADENAGATKDQGKSEAGDEGLDEEDAAEEEAAKNRDMNEMPQVDVATLAKRKWQVKVYPLKPEDFMSGQISRVFGNARESLLYILSSGRYSGGKGEMYVSSGGHASRVVQNLMKLDFKSPNINIEIIKKNDEGEIEEKAFMRFDAKLVRILCVPALPSKRMGSKRERIIGSVFVKNLPKGTSKDMLRVMFPFAPEINFNPEKFHDGTARLVLSTRSAVAPCLRAFAKVELGDTSLELRPLQKSSKKEEGKDETSGKSESEGATKEEKGSPRRESSTREQSKASSKKSPSTSKATDVKKEKGDTDQKPKPDTRKTYSAGVNSRNRKTRDQNSNNSRWIDRRGDSGLYNARNRFRGGTMGQKGDNRSRFRSGGVGFGIRNRSDERRMRPGLQGPVGDAGITTTETTKEMIILQSQLSMAIKNQLSMLNQTQFALEQAKRGAVGMGLSREPQATSSAGLLGSRVSDQYGMSQLQPEHARRGQIKAGNRRQQQTRRGNNRTRDKRPDGERLLSLTGGGDYGYKRSANLAGLQQDYGASGFGKRRNTGMAARESHQSWAEDPSAFGHQQQSHFGYEHEVDDRDAEFRSMQAGMSQNSMNYGHSNYGYRY